MWVSFLWSPVMFCPRKGVGAANRSLEIFRASLAVQWLRLRASTAGGTGLISGQGTKICLLHSISSVQFSGSVTSDSLWPHGLQHQASLSITNSRILLKLMSIELVMPSNHLILCHPLLLLLPIFPSIRVFSSESALHIRWPKYCSFGPSNEYSRLISFRIDWFDLAVQGTLKSLLQHHSSKASVLQHSTFFMVQL